jgi:hypothetical protein
MVMEGLSNFKLRDPNGDDNKCIFLPGTAASFVIYKSSLCMVKYVYGKCNKPGAHVCCIPLASFEEQEFLRLLHLL